MTSCRIVDVSFSHDGALPLFERVSLHLTPGWYGLVGENGAGKTTLLRLLTGELEPDTGSVRWQPASPRIVVCAQDVEVPPEGAVELAEGTSAESAVWRGRLGLRGGELERWETLSPGERKRWQVGAALATGPDVLLLDEPSNHLDAEAREMLCAALREFPGLGVVVSHQRELLEELTSATLRVHRGAGHGGVSREGGHGARG
jgi:ATPase subunit of ABC transporter with duplicated ATPase domains